MLQIIQPHIRCVTDQSGFKDALTQGYNEIFIITPKGYFKHKRLSGGRYVRMEVPDLPKEYKTKIEEEVYEELNFLPAGKIPIEFLHQITKFFKEVMRVKDKDLEAHAFILWSKERGYYISIPKQVVSKASVSFTYDKETIPDGSVICVDIHSHNTMSSFFSSTDNANDANGIYYSGVIGRLDLPEPKIVLRFNLHSVKKEVQIQDIFEEEVKEVSIDESWMKQIEVATRTPISSPPSYGKSSKYKDYDGDMNPYGRYPSLWDLYESNALHPNYQDVRIDQRTGLVFEEYEEDIDPVGAEADRKMEISNAVEQVEIWLSDLEGEDDILLEVLQKGYELLSKEGQIHLATHGF